MSSLLRSWLLVLGLVASSTGLQRPAAAATIDRVAAVVDNDVLTLSEVYELGGDYIEQASASSGGDPKVRRELELEVLDTLILRRLISQEMVRLGMDVTEEELERSIDDIGCS